MNFMQWLSSLDELLYEVMSWVLFLPVTLWRVLTGPLSMMAYADSQLGLPDTEQYQEALSPPLFLALCLLLAHTIELALGDTNALVTSRHGLAALIKDDSSLLLLRLLLFAIFPLAMALRSVRSRKLALDRSTLRLPFYAQCYPTAAFALAISIGGSASQAHLPALRTAGSAIFVIAPLIYLLVEARWFAVLGGGLLRGFGSALLAFAQGLVAFLAIALIVVH
ncbi:hypothetical protein ABC347_07540 [Sphingomonas sp. 1P06PA]|uniref:hypothetical protein n=1 Tax=Sphingomonas sp. 1P06PA TaxID=554121 RepID=UPI0039A4D8C7